MTGLDNYDEACRVLAEADHNPAGDRLVHVASVRALLAIVDELRGLREGLTRLADARSASSEAGRADSSAGARPPEEPPVLAVGEPT
jgi:hypothetical protein